MSRQMHVVRVAGISHNEAVMIAKTFMERADSGDNGPGMIAAYTPATGEKTGFSTIFSVQPPNEDEILVFCRKLRFAEIFSNIPKGIAPWRTTTLANKDEDPDYLRWQEREHDNKVALLQYADSVRTAADERKFALPMLKKWIQAIEEGDEAVTKCPELTNMVEAVAAHGEFPFSYGNNLYASRCHVAGPFNRDNSPYTYAIFSVHV